MNLVTLALLAFPSLSAAYPQLSDSVRETITLKVDVSTVACVPTTDEGYPKDLQILTLKLSSSPKGSRFVYESARQTSYDAMHSQPCAQSKMTLLYLAGQSGGELTVEADVGAYINGAAGELPDGRTMVTLHDRAVFMMPRGLSLVSYRIENVPDDDARVRPLDSRFPTYHKRARSVVAVDLASLSCNVRDIPELGDRFRSVYLRVNDSLPNARLEHPLFQSIERVAENAEEAVECAGVEALKKLGAVDAKLLVIALASNTQDNSTMIFEDATLELPGLNMLSNSIERLPFSDVRTK